MHAMHHLAASNHPHPEQALVHQEQGLGAVLARVRLLVGSSGCRAMGDRSRASDETRQQLAPCCAPLQQPWIHPPASARSKAS